jgi:AraC-like DNA-binding protein
VLIHRFRTAVGLPPKAMARLLRFNRVMRCLDRLSRTRVVDSVSQPFIESSDPACRLNAPIPRAELAAECGYADQAHLIRDFHEFAGSTPQAFLRCVSYEV